MEHKVRTPNTRRNPRPRPMRGNGRLREEAQQIHVFLLRQPATVYAAFLGVAFGAIILSVTFAIGAVEVGGPRWVWPIDLLVVVGFMIDHVRFHRQPTQSTYGTDARCSPCHRRSTYCADAVRMLVI